MRPKQEVEVKQQFSGRYEVNLLTPGPGSEIAVAGKGLFDTRDAAMREALRVAAIYGTEVHDKSTTHLPSA